jgi:hypothetical protein
MEKCNGDFLPPGFGTKGCQPTTARTLCSTSFTRRGMQQPDVATVALIKRTYVHAFPALPLLQSLPSVRCTHLSPIRATADSCRDVEDGAAPSTPTRLQLGDREGSSGKCSSLAEQTATAVWSRMGVGLSPASGSPPVRTDLQRFMLMRQTVNERLCHGKSAIHGTGVFARINHKAGDWLVEYAGASISICICMHMSPPAM